MLRYLAWVIRSIRKDLAMGNYVAIWQKTLARFGLIGEILARLLTPSSRQLVAVRLGVDLGEADEALVAAGCIRHGFILATGFQAPGMEFEHRSKLLGIITLSNKTELVVDSGEVRYSVVRRIGRLRLNSRTVTSRFHNPPAAQPLVLRELARLKLIDFESYLNAWLQSLPAQRLDPEAAVVLYLPEVGLRNPGLASEQLTPFAGITAAEGWVGCASSYRALAQLAKRSGTEELTVLEDDALLPNDWRDRWKEARKLLSTGKANVVSGLVSDLQRLPDDWHVERVGSSEFFVSGHFSSTVFTIFRKAALSWLASHPSHASDPNTEGIDRYLATMPGIRVAAFTPALVEHDPKARSTLWRFNNRTYQVQITLAQRLLENAIRVADAESQTRRAD